MTRIFTGDYSTGDFSQWYQIANVTYAGNTVNGSYPGAERYPLQIVPLDGDCGYCARFEVRNGDRPPFIPLEFTERSEVFGKNGTTDVLAGETAWWAHSFKLDESWPDDHLNLLPGEGAWCIITQWHDIATLFSPVIGWGWAGSYHGDPTEGFIFLYQHQLYEDGSGAGWGTQRLLQLPMNRGEWHDIKIEMKLSGLLTHDSSNPGAGMLRVWHNGEPQPLAVRDDDTGALISESTTFYGQTMAPTATGVLMQQGIYRADDIAETDIVFQTGLRIASSEASL